MSFRIATCLFIPMKLRHRKSENGQANRENSLSVDGTLCAAMSFHDRVDEERMRCATNTLDATDKYSDRTGQYVDRINRYGDRLNGYGDWISGYGDRIGGYADATYGY